MKYSTGKGCVVLILDVILHAAEWVWIRVRRLFKRRKR
jgi:hypothetical protein